MHSSQSKLYPLFIVHLLTAFPILVTVDGNITSLFNICILKSQTIFPSIHAARCTERIFIKFESGKLQVWGLESRGKWCLFLGQLFPIYRRNVMPSSSGSRAPRIIRGICSVETSGYIGCLQEDHKIESACHCRFGRLAALKMWHLSFYHVCE
jgi:hypothetical protein